MAEDFNPLIHKSNYYYLIIFFVVTFISDDTFTFGTNQTFGFIIVKYVMYFLLTVLLLVKNSLQSYIYPTKANLALVFISFAVILTAALNIDLTGGYIYQIWLALLAFLITQYIPREQLVKVFTQYIYVLSIISIIIYIIASYFPFLLNPFPVQMNTGDVEFHNLGIGIVFKDVQQVRNTGIYREPGVFMIYLMIAIIMELFFNEVINKKKLIIIIIALLLTFSTAAFIILAVVCVAYLFKNNDKNTVKNKVFILLAGVAIVVVVLLSSDIYSLVFDKIGKDSINEGSSLARGASVLINLQIFFDNPIKGVGISNFENSYSLYSLKLFNLNFAIGNNTNTITTIFAIYGILFGMIFCCLVFMLAKKLSNLIIPRVLIALALLMMFSNEDLRYSLMSFVFLFWGLKSEPDTNDLGNAVLE